YSIASNSLGVTYAGTNKGVYSSLDSGKTWSIFAFSGREIYSIVIGTSNSIYAWGYELYYTSNNGASWDSVNALGSGSGEFLKINSKDYLYRVKLISSSSGLIEVLYRSKNKGQTWTALAQSNAFSTIYKLAVGSNDVLIMATNKGLFRSTDDGDTWTIIPGISTSLYHNIIAMPNNVFYAESYNILYSNDNGVSFKEIQTPDNIGMVSSLCVIPNEMMLIQTSSTKGTFLYCSADGGASWNNVTSGLWDFMREIFYTPNGNIYVLTGPIINPISYYGVITKL
ncbi:MAG: hypothetical protein JNL74_18680, partial [Fibrobacteres bacterium]|nr:hypothetical protein [Fibrobacterota bacterium]